MENLTEIYSVLLSKVSEQDMTLYWQICHSQKFLNEEKQQQKSNWVPPAVTKKSLALIGDAYLDFLLVKKAIERGEENPYIWVSGKKSRTTLAVVAKRIDIYNYFVSGGIEVSDDMAAENIEELIGAITHLFPETKDDLLEDLLNVIVQTESVRAIGASVPNGNYITHLQEWCQDQKTKKTLPTYSEIGDPGLRTKGGRNGVPMAFQAFVIVHQKGDEKVYGEWGRKIKEAKKFAAKAAIEKYKI